MRVFATIALFTASPVLAECPTASDLANGVQIVEADGTVNLFTALGNGIVKNDGTAPDGYTYRNVLAQGTHLIELGDTENGAYISGSLRVVDYQMQPDQMPIPAPNTTWVVDTIVDNGSEYDERQTQSWGAITTLSIGECSYEMIPGKVSYINSDYTVFEGLHYLPGLELGILHSYQIQGEPPSHYVATSIEAVQ
ncbi:hypothetical protein N9O61_00445 [Octadecabacter sp.]|nr:hypothetical protein [Octadecabacter sp.]